MAREVAAFDARRAAAEDARRREELARLEAEAEADWGYSRGTISR